MFTAKARVFWTAARGWTPIGSLQYRRGLQTEFVAEANSENALFSCSLRALHNFSERQHTVFCLSRNFEISRSGVIWGVPQSLCLQWH